jgi:hypothetical protein
MLMIKLLENDTLLNAEFALNQANCSNIIELCEKYIKLLTEYREELYKFRGAPEINLFQATSLARELAEQTRKSIRSAVEMTTRERNHTESLLKSFTAISGYEAVKTFNQLEYKGFTDWELRANQVRLENDVNNEKITLQEAVETASLLRREAYISYKTTFFS